jgi:predicted NUDIX family phosphoesterase
LRGGVEHLADLGLRQVKKVLDAYATRDVEKAREVCAQDQEIDAVYTSLFRELGYFQGFSDKVDLYMPRLFEGDHVQYRPRGEMEENPDFKQLIPYVLFRWVDTNGQIHLFQYLRGGGMGERRLHFQLNRNTACRSRAQ